MPFFHSYTADLVAGVIALVVMLTIARMMGVWDAHSLWNRDGDSSSQ